jgi:prolyl 4-hydroxylase
MVPYTSPAVETGQAVLERLAANPCVSKLPTQAVDIYVVPNFLTEQECAGIIALIEAGKVPSTLMQEEPDKEFRTSSTCHMDRCEPLVRGVESKITSLMGIEPSHGETMQGQHYSVGQQFKPHNDYFHFGMPYWDGTRKRGGQRTWTVMVCLNDVAEGGQTNFPLAGLCLQPRRGNAILWNNLNRAGEPNPMTLHQGMPVLRGSKYIITKWYREGEWVPRQDVPNYGLAAPYAMAPLPAADSAIVPNT